MKPFGIGVTAILLSVLQACTTAPADGTSGRSGQNPFEYCNSQGMGDGTEEFDNCVADYIHQYCKERGAEPGTEAYRKCTSSLREATFLREQMQIRGY